MFFSCTIYYTYARSFLKDSFIITKRYLPVNVPILYPLKTPENFGFLVFLGCIKWEIWPEMSSSYFK